MNKNDSNNRREEVGSSGRLCVGDGCGSVGWKRRFDIYSGGKVLTEARPLVRAAGLGDAR